MRSEDRAAIVDEYGALDAELNTAERKKQIKRLKELSAKIQGWYAESPADKTFSESGHIYTVTVSARANAREFRPGAVKRLAKALGSVFWKLCKVTLGDFDDHVPIDERSKYVDESQSGPRRIEVIAKPTQKRPQS